MLCISCGRWQAIPYGSADMLPFPVVSLCFSYCAAFLLGPRTLLSTVPSYFHSLTPLSCILLHSSLFSLPFLSFLDLLRRDIVQFSVHGLARQKQHKGVNCTGCSHSRLFEVEDGAGVPNSCLSCQSFA